MKIYLLNIALIAIYAILFLNKSNYKSKKHFCILTSINWIIISGLRHITIGADTYVYKVYMFDKVVHSDWNQILSNFLGIYLRGEIGKDPGYTIFQKIIQIFTVNYQIYLIIIAIIFTISLGMWIYKNSNEPFISFLLYSVLFYSFYAITGHRQTIATALGVLFGYEFIKKRKILPFIVLVLIAFTVHKSIIAFFPFYFLANNKITKKYLIFILASFPIIFIFRFELIRIIVSLVGYEQYMFQYEGAGTWTFTTLLLMVFVVTIWKHKIILSSNPQAVHYINALILAIVFVPLTFINPSLMRLVQYYSIFLILLIPEIILSFNRRERVIVYYIATGLLLALFIRNNPQYLFFWQ